MDEELREMDFTEADFTENAKKSFSACKFYSRRAGVECPPEKQGGCYKCGWNPKIEKQRKAKIRERMEYNSVH